MQNQSKIAAIPWQSYQRQRPSETDLNTWFGPEEDHNLGIVTGRISRLCVLDFDDEALYAAFKLQHPVLAQTRTVRTKRGYHLYYTVPVGAGLISRSGEGVDLKYEGGYVVAPPSIVDGHSYKLVQGGQPRLLDHDAIQQINTLVGHRQPVPVSVAEPTSDMSTNALIGLYLAYRSAGRNNALFQTACTGRDHGLSQSTIIDALAHLHATQKANGSHRNETYAQRHREALRTIASAFKRPARKVKRSLEIAQLPNNIRETLLKRKWTHTLRTIEALRLFGVRAGQVFSRQDALRKLNGIVGRNSIDFALNHSGLFELSFTPPNYVAQEKCLTDINSCELIRAKIQGNYFIMPSNEDLRQKLNLPFSPISDRLTLADLASAKATRAAIHVAYLRRRPGQYPIKWLARRTGVTVRTIQTYNAENPEIHARAVYTFTPVYWFNLGIVPEIGQDGLFLTDETGKKYPAKREVGHFLLGKGAKVRLYRQEPNYWWVGTPDDPGGQHYANQRQHTHFQDWKAAQRRTFVKPAYPVSDKPVPGTSEPPKLPPERNNSAVQPVPVKKSRRKANPRRKLRDRRDEVVALRTYEIINAMSSQRGAGRMSLVSARRLVIKYGRDTVDLALKTVQNRRNVSKPVGLLSTILRSDAVFR